MVAASTPGCSSVSAFSPSARSCALGGRFWPDTGNVWLAAMLLGGALVWWHISQRDHRTQRTEAPTAEAAPAATTTTPAASITARQPKPPRPPAKPSLFAPVLGSLLGLAGLLGLLAVLDIYDVDVAVALALALVVVGAAIAFGALTQRRVGGLVVLGLLLLPAFGVAAVTPVSVSAGVGDKLEQPVTAAALDPSYELGVGKLELDLTSVPLSAGTTEVDASVGVGELVITVPDDVALELDAHAGVGDLDLLGEQHDGVDVHRTLSVPGPTPDAPVLDLEADVAIGHIEVLRG